MGCTTDGIQMVRERKKKHLETAKQKVFVVITLHII